MKILFVKPYWSNFIFGLEATYNRIWPPLCLLNCAALLEREGHYVRILDAHADKITAKRAQNYADGFDKIFITSSTLDCWQCPRVEISSFIDTVNALAYKNKEVYCMGYHGTVMPTEILRVTLAKAVIREEPEQVVLDICSGKKNSEIEGLTYRENDGIMHNRDKPPLDINSLPVPAFHLINLQKYYYEILGLNFIILEGSRGCRHKCTFCNKVMFGDGVRIKDAHKLIKEIEIAVGKHNAKSCQFIDLDFIANRPLVEEVCDFLFSNRFDFRWSCQARIDSVDKKILKKMKKAGCSLIEYGVETGSSRIAEKMRKNISIERIIESVQVTREAKIKTLCFFLFGFPDETMEDIKMTFELVKRLKSDYVSFHIVQPYQGTELGKDTQHNFNKECLSRAYINNQSFRELKKMIRNKLTNFYLRPQLIFKEVFKDDISLVFKKIRLFLSYMH